MNLQVEGEALRAGVAVAAGVDLVVNLTEEAAGVEADVEEPAEEAGPTSSSSLTDTPGFSLPKEKTTCS